MSRVWPRIGTVCGHREHLDCRDKRTPARKRRADDELKTVRFEAAFSGSTLVGSQSGQCAMSTKRE